MNVKTADDFVKIADIVINGMIVLGGVTMIVKQQR